jgi:hypothetical protein
MKDLDFTTQHDVLEKFISHPLLNNMFFYHLVDLQRVKGNHEVLSNMKIKITKHLVGQKKFDLVVVKDIVCMLTSRSSNGNSKGVAKLLGVDKGNIQKGMGRGVQLDNMKNAFWTTWKWTTCSNATP